jgi:hypothetical protein
MTLSLPIVFRTLALLTISAYLAACSSTSGITRAAAGVTISVIGPQNFSKTVSLLPNAQGCINSLASTT